MTPTPQPQAHILVVDDDARLRDLLKKYLGDQGFFISTAANTLEAEDVLRAFVVDGIVLDVMMPGETGIAYATRLKSRADAPPVLLLTARGEADDRIAGLEAGAADYLGKPFAPKELLLRLENILARRREQRVTRQAVVFGDYRFDLVQGRLSYLDAPVYLTTSECECLRVLAQSAGTPLSREAIASALGDVSNERSVDVQINRLRKKIEPQPSKPIYLQTIRHAGYALYAEPI
jgi:two-component system phosphate regulon response regulator OmpR